MSNDASYSLLFMSKFVKWNERIIGISLDDTDSRFQLI